MPTKQQSIIRRERSASRSTRYASRLPEGRMHEFRIIPANTVTMTYIIGSWSGSMQFSTDAPLQILEDSWHGLISSAHSRFEKIIREGEMIREYRLSHSISIEVEGSEDDFVASCTELDIAESGDSVEDAIESLKSLMIELHEDYIDSGDEPLGDRLMSQQQALLQLLSHATD